MGAPSSSVVGATRGTVDATEWTRCVFRGTQGRAGMRAGERASVDPELLKEGGPEWVGLVVAHALGDEHEGAAVDERNRGRCGVEIAVHPLPKRVCLRSAPCLRRRDSRLEAAVAESGQVCVVDRLWVDPR